MQQEKSLTEVAVHAAKVRVHQGRRLLAWWLQPRHYPRPRLAAGGYEQLLWRKSVPIERPDGDAHPLLEAGKVTNLKLAAPYFDGLELGPGQPLSFWRTLGQVTARRGFRHGMELKAGCIVPALGGGLCLLSNELFGLAAHLGWTILERWGHTMEAVPSYTRPWGLDATIFWPYVDLRVEPPYPCRLEVKATDELSLIVRAHQPLSGRVELYSRDDAVGEGWRSNTLMRRRFDRQGSLLADEVIGHNRKRILTSPARRRNCLTCGETACKARVQL